MSEIIEKKTYELRELQSKDLFPMFGLLNKIGFVEVRAIFESDNVRKLVLQKVGDDANASAIGISVAIEVAGVVISNLPKCETEIYAFLSSLSGIKVKDLQSMGIATFMDMIVDTIQKEEFKDFFKVVSKLFK